MVGNIPRRTRRKEVMSIMRESMEVIGQHDHGLAFKLRDVVQATIVNGKVFPDHITTTSMVCGAYNDRFRCTS